MQIDLAASPRGGWSYMYPLVAMGREERSYPLAARDPEVRAQYRLVFQYHHREVGASDGLSHWKQPHHAAVSCHGTTLAKETFDRKPNLLVPANVISEQRERPRSATWCGYQPPASSAGALECFAIRSTHASPSHLDPKRLPMI
jgi:hypothetical protein